MRRFLVQSAWVLLLSLIAASMTWLVTPQPPLWSAASRPGAIGAAELQVLPDDTCIIWLDARSPEQYQAGHLPGAIHCSEDDWRASLDAYLQAWQPDCLTVIYCDGQACQASTAVAERLRQATGFDNIHVFHGEWRTWQP